MKTLWEKCLADEKTIVLIQTNQNQTYGFYTPTRIESTSNSGKLIEIGQPFGFYFINDKFKLLPDFEDDRIYSN